MRYLILLSFIVCIASCKKKGCSESALTKEKLQGNWTHEYPDREPDFTQPDEYKFIYFAGDSFFLKVVTHTDIILPTADPCTGNYAKGVYEITGGKLLLHGVYSNAEFMDGCGATGPYEQAFFAYFCNMDMLLREVTPKVNWPNYTGPKMVKE
jgi:hypothetical protein